MTRLLHFINFLFVATFLFIVFLVSIIYFPNALEFTIKKYASYQDYNVEFKIRNSGLQNPASHIFHLDFIEIESPGDEGWRFRVGNTTLKINLISSLLSFQPQLLDFSSEEGEFRGSLKKYLYWDYQTMKSLFYLDSFEVKDFKIIPIDQLDEVTVLRAKVVEKKGVTDFTLKIQPKNTGIFLFQGEIQATNRNDYFLDTEVKFYDLSFKENSFIRYFCDLCSHFGVLEGEGQLTFRNGEVQKLKGSFSSNLLKGKISILDGIKKGVDLSFDFVNLYLSEEKDSFLSAIKDRVFFPISLKIDELFVDNKYRGKWSFNFDNSDTLNLRNIEGFYGAWHVSSVINESSVKLDLSKDNWKTLFKGDVYTAELARGLKELGYPNSISAESARFNTDIMWPGSLIDFNLSNIKGLIRINSEGVLFKNIDKELRAESNYLRFISIFNLTDTFEKVTNLDFTKLLSSGYGVDKVTGLIDIQSHSFNIKESIYFKSGASEIKWNGSALRDNKGNFTDINFYVETVLPLKEYIPAYGLVLGGPITAGALYIAGKIFEKELDGLGTGGWAIKGRLSDPEIEFLGWNN